MTDRQLLIMRHAHAQPPGGLGEDHLRALTPRGHLAARGKREILLGLHPEHVICSTATRTRQTLDSLDLDIPATYSDELYHGGVEDYRRVVSTVDDGVQRLLLIAHMPTVEQLATWLAGRAAPLGTFQPSAVAVIDVEVPWAAVGDGDGVLVDFHE